ncbi:TIGR02391 family protein [Nocardia sp. CA-084685]|uniref:TIGR02391 family protein n=1 Tax=Nocardia sp. CA-084685 TaxID=3239970 RepID=UPI003D975C0B
MGASQGVRNVRAHGNPLDTPEQDAHEMLALASLLMRMLDRAEARQSGKPIV